MDANTTPLEQPIDQQQGVMSQEKLAIILINFAKVLATRRPSWPEYHMMQAVLAATKSSCVKLKAGAVIVQDKRIIATGYNGASPNAKNCLDRGCRKVAHGIGFHDKGKAVCRGVHAEVNAMTQVTRAQTIGATLYTVIRPCSACAKQIATMGITEVVYYDDYFEPDTLTLETFEESNIKLRKFQFPDC